MGSAAARVSAFDPVSVVFAGVEPRSGPELLLVVGQPGSGATRLVPTLVDGETNMGAVAAEDFAAFHPSFLELTSRQPFEAPGVMAPQVAEWIGRTLDHARETRRSLLFQTSVTTSAPMLATAEQFRDAGFSVRVVVVAERRHESMLATASRYLNARRLRLPARFTDKAAHDRGWAGTRLLAREAETASAVDRLTVLDRTGAALFDVSRPGEFTGAAATVEAVDTAPVTVLEGARWFGELRAITDFARRSRELAPPLAEVLLELHQRALTDVFPKMPVAQESSFVAVQEERLRGEIRWLQTELGTAPKSPAPTPEPSGPVATPTRSPGGPSL
jgi:hypothetical protein